MVYKDNTFERGKELNAAKKMQKEIKDDSTFYHCITSEWPLKYLQVSKYTLNILTNTHELHKSLSYVNATVSVSKLT